MQQKISARYYQWLMNAIGDWQTQNLISKDQGEQIAACYQPQDNTAFIPVLMGVLAATLVGGGVILLVAHNWQGFSQTVRAVISFLPLLISQIFLWWANGRDTLARESTGVIHAMSVGASLALISQTFHYAGDLNNFLSAWLLLILPVAICYRAQSVQVAALALSMWFVTLADLGQWRELLVALAVPLTLWFAAWRGNRIVTRWFYVANITWLMLQCIGEWRFLSEWSLLSLLASVYYYVGVLFQPAASYWRNPLRLFGAIGVFVLTVGFCFFYDELSYGDAFSVSSVATIVAVLLGVLVLAMRSKRISWQQTLYAAIPLVVLIFDYIFVDHSLNHSLTIVMFWMVNLFILLTGVWLSIQGQSQARLGKMNAALLIVASVVLARFFDADDSFLTRGVLFIGAGMALFIFNYYYLKKKKSLTTVAEVA